MARSCILQPRLQMAMVYHRARKGHKEKTDPNNKEAVTATSWTPPLHHPAYGMRTLSATNHRFICMLTEMLVSRPLTKFHTVRIKLNKKAAEHDGLFL
jgi:hypothetical protein